MKYFFKSALLLCAAAAAPLACATGTGSSGRPYPEPTHVYHETDPEAVAPENIFYVDRAGDDDNPGTVDRPWRTVQKAAATLSAGQKVYVRGGVYREYVSVKNSGVAGAPIVLSAHPGEEVVIEGDKRRPTDTFAGLFTVDGKRHVTVKGFKVRAANGTGMLVRNSSHVVIRDNLTYDTWSSGIGAWFSRDVIVEYNEVILACNDGPQECLSAAGCERFEVRYNKVHHSGPGTRGGEGIDTKHGNTGRVHHNTVHDNNRLGIYVDSWDTHTHGIEVYANVCYRNRKWGICCAAENGGLLENIAVYNNLCYDNELVGIGVESWGEDAPHPMRDIWIYNNTVCGNGNANAGSWSGGIHVNAPAGAVSGVYIGNNVFSGNRPRQISIEAAGRPANLVIENNLCDGAAGETGVGTIPGDPLFKAVANKDFRLKAGSPAIDAAAATHVPARDFDGATRPKGSGYDIGAFEY